MKDFFINLFEYNHSCNQKIAEAFEANPDMVSDNANKLFSHILNAHHIWNCRIGSSKNSFGVWDIHPVNELADIDKGNFENSLLILDKYDLDTVIHYANTKGQSFQNSIRDILFHGINHSTYHRA